MTSKGSAADKPYPLWDLPVRLIHWLIVGLLPASWWTAEEGYLEVHQWLGLTLLVAVLTRLVWGVVGSPQARFADFARGPRAVISYLRAGKTSTPGHNPLGGWSAMLFWLVLFLQALTGTVNSDDVLFTGPFHYVFDSSASDWLASLHEPLFKVIVALVVLHVLAIAYYERVRGQRLLRPMIRGLTEGRVGTGPAQPVYKALLAAALLAGLLWYLLGAAPAPPSNSYW
ncbi:MAG: cytochrome b [Halieaceae bacterium]|jgi:cytochrome b